VENRKAYRARREAALAAGHELVMQVPGEAESTALVVSGVEGESGPGAEGAGEEDDDEDYGGADVAYAAERRKLRERITFLEDKLQVHFINQSTCRVRLCPCASTVSSV
jgi:hypothetical protein